MPPTFISELDTCPACGVTWAYEEGGQRWSRVIGRVVRDRLREWTCPDCRRTWVRGALVEGGVAEGDGPRPGALRTTAIEVVGPE